MQMDTEISFIRQVDQANLQNRNAEIQRVRQNKWNWFRNLSNRLSLSVYDVITASTIGDFAIHSLFVMISIFILAQNGNIIPFNKSIIFYFSTIYNFVISIMLIWLSKEVIEWRYQTSVYTFYSSSRLLAHLINMLLLILNLSNQIGYVSESDENGSSKNQNEKEAEETKRLKVEVFMMWYFILMTIHFIYIIITSYYLIK